MEAIKTKKEELIALLDQLMVNTPAHTDAEKKRIYRAQTLYQATKQPATVFSQEELLQKFIVLFEQAMKEHTLGELLPIALSYGNRARQFPENLQSELDSLFSAFVVT